MYTHFNERKLYVVLSYSFLCLSRNIEIGIPLCITKPGLGPGFVMHKGTLKYEEFCYLVEAKNFLFSPVRQEQR